MRDPAPAGDTPRETSPGEALFAARLQKAHELEAMGVCPWANDFAPSMTADAFQAAFADTCAPAPDRPGGAPADAADVRLAGRVVAINRFGKAAFLRLVDGAGRGALVRQQVYLRRDQLSAADWEVFARCDLGDIVGAAGRPMRTKTGELTLAAGHFRLLTKALRPLPEKWHGLHDLEKRTRMRYLDLLANDDSRRVFLARARILAALRAALTRRDFIEVETPMMHAVAGGAAARPFRTHHQALDLALFLRIAPELHLKRLLVGGLPRVFEINRNFRNEGMSPVHNPEFTMLEFYQAFSHCQGMMDLTEALVAELAIDLLGAARRVRWQGHDIDLTPPFRRLGMAESLVAAGVAEAARPDARAPLAGALAARRLPVPQGGAGACLADLFEHLVEPTLVQPTFITDFPAEISPLSRRRPEDPERVDRFELYVGGRELANAFSELNDPRDQRARFVAQRAAALAEATDPSAAAAIDEDYLLALEHGMPPAGGCGIGVDRLVMLLTGCDAIRDVILFPLMRPDR